MDVTAVTPDKNCSVVSAYISGAVVIPSCACPASVSIRASRQDSRERVGDVEVARTLGANLQQHRDIAGPRSAPGRSGTRVSHEGRPARLARRPRSGAIDPRCAARRARRSARAACWRRTHRRTGPRHRPLPASRARRAHLASTRSATAPRRARACGRGGAAGRRPSSAQ